MATLARIAAARARWGASHSTHSTRNLFSKKGPVQQSKLRTALYTTSFALGAGLFAVYYFDARSAIHRYILTPLLRYVVDAETGHKIAVKVLRSGLGPRDPLQDDNRLRFQARPCSIGVGKILIFCLVW